MAACIWSESLENKGRVSSELYHISDWLPTFLGLAGSPIPSGLDGFNIWDSVSKGVPSPRTELLHQTDPQWNDYALRWNQYKLIIGSHGNEAGTPISGW